MQAKNPSNNMNNQVNLKAQKENEKSTGAKHKGIENSDLNDRRFKAAVVKKIQKN